VGLESRARVYRARAFNDPQDSSSPNERKTTRPILFLGSSLRPHHHHTTAMQDTTTPARPLYLTPARSIASTVYDTAPPRPRLDVFGYTVRAGSPTPYRVRLEGENRWRRVYAWCFSNAGTLFVRIGGVPHIVKDYDLE
jgi:hypothetical protein